jgi:hypothetical protein
MKRQSVNIFYSYSHKDEELKERLEEHLSTLRHKGIIKEFNDRKIVSGEEWEKEISEKLQNADIILFLLSASFLNSDYCYDIEVKSAIKKYKEGNVLIIPVIIRPCDWKESPLGKFQALPKDGKAITLWPNDDQAWMDVVNGIKKAISNEKVNSSLKQDIELNGNRKFTRPVHGDYADNASIQIKNNSGNINITKG